MYKKFYREDFFYFRCMLMAYFKLLKKRNVACFKRLCSLFNFFKPLLVIIKNLSGGDGGLGNMYLNIFNNFSIVGNFVLWIFLRGKN